jgi:antitoxin VapB
MVSLLRWRVRTWLFLDERFHLMTTNQLPTLKSIARIGWYKGSQTVTMPLGYRFPKSVREVFIRREGESLVLTPRPTDWSSFLASGLKASDDFMADSKRMPIQDRSFNSINE